MFCKTIIKQRARGQRLVNKKTNELWTALDTSSLLVHLEGRNENINIQRDTKIWKYILTQYFVFDTADTYYMAIRQSLLLLGWPIERLDRDRESAMKLKGREKYICERSDIYKSKKRHQGKGKCTSSMVTLLSSFGMSSMLSSDGGLTPPPDEPAVDVAGYNGERGCGRRSVHIMN